MNAYNPPTRFQQAMDRIEQLEVNVAKLMSTAPPVSEYSPQKVRPLWEAIPQEEKDAGWWHVQFLFRNCDWRWIPDPGWLGDDRYRVVKTNAHPDNDRHARIKLEWSKVEGKGTHELWSCPAGSNAFWGPASGLDWSRSLDYEIRPIQKPQFDVRRLPIGAKVVWTRVTDKYQLECKLMAHFSDNSATVWNDIVFCRNAPYDQLDIGKMDDWEVLKDGDIIPPGVDAETRTVLTGGSTVVTVFRIKGKL